MRGGIDTKTNLDATPHQSEIRPADKQWSGPPRLVRACSVRSTEMASRLESRCGLLSSVCHLCSECCDVRRLHRPLLCRCCQVTA